MNEEQKKILAGLQDFLAKIDDSPEGDAVLQAHAAFSAVSDRYHFALTALAAALTAQVIAPARAQARALQLKLDSIPVSDSDRGLARRITYLEEVLEILEEAHGHLVSPHYNPFDKEEYAMQLLAEAAAVLARALA